MNVISQPRVYSYSSIQNQEDVGTTLLVSGSMPQPPKTSSVEAGAVAAPNAGSVL